ncbi:vWA domain-containing protein [Dermacoccus abyssi]|uniref:vWA domain-containing protein n=1 Tax=Dermacoccus abyssi TaxID=322596 RepID=UPI002AD259B7|nr:vWA domain-containing protein [Dermacoccus abyssi]
MAAGWTRKSFSSDGVTEYPVGPNFERLRSRFGGAVVLALDVSGSMQGDRLIKAVKGCKRFIDEAVEAGYRVGLILWHHDVAADVPPEADPKAARELLRRAADSSGGTNVLACLGLAHRQLMATDAGDRVLAIFGDGDLGNRQAAETKAAELIADDIRILTCGLGEGSAQELASISTEKAAPRTATSENLADSIASMAQGLIRKG